MDFMNIQGASRCVLSLALVAVAFLIRLSALPIEAGAQYLTFYPAVVASFYLFGRNIGIGTLVASAAVAYYGFFPPFFSWTIRFDPMISTVIYMLSAGAIGFAVSGMRESQRRAAARLRELTVHLANTTDAFSGLSRQDFSTGLPNELGGREMLQAEFVRTARTGDAFSVLLLEIGHAAVANSKDCVSDEVFRRCGQILRNTLRESDLIARIGDRQFLVLLPSTKREEAVLVAAKAQGAIEAAKKDLGSGIVLHAGIATSSSDQSDGGAVLREASDFLLRVKAGQVSTMR
jgi:diguanylate cyclase (GGDEF)-like protein